MTGKSIEIQQVHGDIVVSRSLNTSLLRHLN
jgi:hypothetical protein